MDWLKSRVLERTSWDGGALVAVGLVVLFLGPFAKWAAYAAIAWGLWAIVTKED
jgi:hypothetical protein|tara:strand:- start:4349 stop:4510 length:162 start_codon:yes stop_codon:yes gene_type:complete